MSSTAAKFFPDPLLTERVAVDLALMLVDRTRDYAAGRDVLASKADVDELTDTLIPSPLLTLPALSDKDFRAIAVSWPGRGRRTAPARVRLAYVDRHEPDDAF